MLKPSFCIVVSATLSSLASVIVMTGLLFFNDLLEADSAETSKIVFREVSRVSKNISLLSSISHCF